MGGNGGAAAPARGGAAELVNDSVRKDFYFSTVVNNRAVGGAASAGGTGGVGCPGHADGAAGSNAPAGTSKTGGIYQIDGQNNPGAAFASLFAGNSADAEANCHDLGNSGGLEYNPAGTCFYTALGGDPGLQSLANNGGPTQTMAVGPGSTAITTNANITRYCVLPVFDFSGNDPGNYGVAGVDQRGVSRSGSRCTVGAYEATASLSALSPSSGDVRGGGPVTLTGTGFSGTTTVTFGTGGGAVTVPGTITSPTTVSVTAPAHALGTVDVTVSTNGTTATIIGGYTFGTVNAIPGPHTPAAIIAGTIYPQPSPPHTPAPIGAATPIPQPTRH